MLTLNFKTTETLENLAQALAEGEHELGRDATMAGSALLGWIGVECPWFVASPTAGGESVVEFAIVEVVS